MDTSMLKGEYVMEAVATARYKWLTASSNYIKAISQALRNAGANEKNVAALAHSISSTPFQTDEGFDYDEGAIHSDDSFPGPGSALESKLLRLAETCAVCGGVFPEGLFDQE